MRQFKWDQGVRTGENGAGLGVSSALGKLGVCNLIPLHVMWTTGMSLLLLKQINVKDAFIIRFTAALPLCTPGTHCWMVQWLESHFPVAWKSCLIEGWLGLIQLCTILLALTEKCNHFSQLLVWIRSSHWFDELGPEMDDEWIIGLLVAQVGILDFNSWEYSTDCLCEKSKHNIWALKLRSGGANRLFFSSGRLYMKSHAKCLWHCWCLTASVLLLRLLTMLTWFTSMWCSPPKD